jgi:hypothetical protein
VSFLFETDDAGELWLVLDVRPCCTIRLGRLLPIERDTGKPPSGC